MDVDGGLVMQEFFNGMGSLFVALGSAAIVGLALGCLMIYFEHCRNNGEE